VNATAWHIPNKLNSTIFSEDLKKLPAAFQRTRIVLIGSAGILSPPTAGENPLPAPFLAWHHQCFRQAMIHGQAATQKTWFQITTLTAPVLAIIIKLRNLVKWQIPAGYQDETGFHFGVQPAEKNLN